MMFPVIMVTNNIAEKTYPFILSNPSPIGVTQTFPFSQTSFVQPPTLLGSINNEKMQATLNSSAQVELSPKNSPNYLSEEDIILLNYFLGNDEQKNQEDANLHFSKSLTSSEKSEVNESSPNSSSLYSPNLHSSTLHDKAFSNYQLQTLQPIIPKFLSSNTETNVNTQVSCTCRRSGCNKLYCHCFRAGKFCSETCSCTSCLNTKGNFSINSKKLHQKQQYMSKQSCQCRRTSCLKHYCACFNAGKYCTDQCRCTECCNFSGSEKLAVKRIVDSYQKDSGNK